MTKRFPVLRVLTLSPRSTRGVLAMGGLRFACSVGRSGMSVRKREGDGTSPRGSWKLTRLFDRADRLAPPRSGLSVILFANTRLNPRSMRRRFALFLKIQKPGRSPWESVPSGTAPHGKTGQDRSPPSR